MITFWTPSPLYEFVYLPPGAKVIRADGTEVVPTSSQRTTLGAVKVASHVDLAELAEVIAAKVRQRCNANHRTNLDSPAV